MSKTTRERTGEPSHALPQPPGASPALTTAPPPVADGDGTLSLVAFLASSRLAVALLTFMAAWLLVGAYVPQLVPVLDLVERFGSNAGSLAAGFDAHGVLLGWPLAGAIALLVVHSISRVMLRRAPNVGGPAGADLAPAGAEWVPLSPDMEMASIQRAVDAILPGLRWVERPGGGVYAEKAAWVEAFLMAAGGVTCLAVGLVFHSSPGQRARVELVEDVSAVPGVPSAVTLVPSERSWSPASWQFSLACGRAGEVLEARHCRIEEPGANGATEVVVAWGYPLRMEGFTLAYSTSTRDGDARATRLALVREGQEATRQSAEFGTGYDLPGTGRAGEKDVTSASGRVAVEKGPDGMLAGVHVGSDAPAFVLTGPKASSSGPPSIDLRSEDPRRLVLTAFGSQGRWWVATGASLLLLVIAVGVGVPHRCVHVVGGPSGEPRAVVLASYNRPHWPARVRRELMRVLGTSESGGSP